jgi:alpha-beta hydrolase superfamily lysophospholipase
MEFIKVKEHKIAVIDSSPTSDDRGIMWCGGFASTMDGTKASYLADWAAQAQVNFLRFDYSGCGASSGDFYDGVISQWKAEARAVFEQKAKAKQIIIASSMGAWVAWDIIQHHANKIAAVILIAPAPDFTEKLLSKKLKAKLADVGTLALDDPSGPLSHRLVEDAKGELVMGAPLKLFCPVHILSGMSDDVVPLSHVLEVVELLDAPSVQLTLIKGGDHSLSAPAHLVQLKDLAEKLYRAL